MDEMAILKLVIIGVLGFIGWLIRERFTALDHLETRVTTIETKMDVMGDINTALNELKTDIAVIKERLEQQDKHKNNH